MQAKIICMASAKGGSGKTSLTATFGTFLSKLGKKILLIDADSATTGLTLLYIKEVRVKAELVHSKSLFPTGLNEALTTITETECDIVELSQYLHLIPASFNMLGKQPFISEKTSTIFNELLSRYRESYDFILIDAQAGADDMSQVAMSRKVSDEVVIVTEYDPMSAAGVERLKALLREDLTYDRTWILLNKILPEFAKSIGDFLEVAKYLTPIPWDAEVVRAYSRRGLAINTDTGIEHTLSIIQVLKVLCGDSIKDELEIWIKSRAAAIRQPIEEQYLDAEKEMGYLLLNRHDLQLVSRKNKLLSRLASVVMYALLFIIVIYVIPDHYFQFASAENYIDFLLANKLFFIALLGIIIITFITFIPLLESYIFELFQSSSIQTKIDGERFDRQIQIVRDKLNHLELMRKLEPEKLIAKNNLISEDSKFSINRKIKYK